VDTPAGAISARAAAGPMPGALAAAAGRAIRVPAAVIGALKVGHRRAGTRHTDRRPAAIGRGVIRHAAAGSGGAVGVAPAGRLKAGTVATAVHGTAHRNDPTGSPPDRVFTDRQNPAVSVREDRVATARRTARSIGSDGPVLASLARDSLVKAWATVRVVRAGRIPATSSREIRSHGESRPGRSVGRREARAPIRTGHRAVTSGIRASRATPAEEAAREDRLVLDAHTARGMAARTARPARDRVRTGAGRPPAARRGRRRGPNPVRGRGPGHRSPRLTCSAPVRSSSRVGARSKRRSQRVGPHTAWSSFRSDAAPSNNSSSMRPGCGSRSSRSRADR
jgi:hypothetical protein